MVRGCQKRIYYIKDPRSALFAEAYFVLKTDGKTLPGERELALEADRIVGDMERRDRLSSCGEDTGTPRRDPIGQRIGAFVIGAASSSAVIGGIALLLALA